MAQICQNIYFVCKNLLIFPFVLIKYIKESKNGSFKKLYTISKSNKKSIRL